MNLSPSELYILIFLSGVAVGAVLDQLWPVVPWVFLKIRRYYYELTIPKEKTYNWKKIRGMGKPLSPAEDWQNAFATSAYRAGLADAMNARVFRHSAPQGSHIRLWLDDYDRGWHDGRK